MIELSFTTRIPLAVMIAIGIKQRENRAAMPKPAAGRCAMTCSKSSDAREYANFLAWAERVFKLGSVCLASRMGASRKLAREVLPYNPDAWIDKSKTKIGYEIPFTRVFYVYKELEKAADIAEHIKSHEKSLMEKLDKLFGEKE